MEKTSVDSRATDNSWVSKKRSELKCYSKNSEGCEEFGEYRCYVMLFPVGAVMSTLEDFSKLGMAFVSEECPLFEKVCVPEHAAGPCMVSAEGVCAAWHKYGGGIFQYG